MQHNNWSKTEHNWESPTPEPSLVSATLFLILLVASSPTSKRRKRVGDARLSRTLTIVNILLSYSQVATVPEAVARFMLSDILISAYYEKSVFSLYSLSLKLLEPYIWKFRYRIFIV